jgi:phosphoribosylformylglycinamidine synthase
LKLPTAANPAAIMFGEDQGRMLVTTSDPDSVAARASAANIFAARIGETGGDAVEGPGFSASLADLRAAHEGFFPKLMGSELTPEF